MGHGVISDASAARGESPNYSLAWAFAWASRGERVHRVLRTKTSDRGAWNPCQDCRTLPVAGAWSRAHSGNFRPRPERAHFPRCARIAEQRGRLGGRRACASCGSGGGGGTAAGRGAGAQNTGGAGAQPPFEGACRSIVSGRVYYGVSQPYPAAAPPLALPCPANARIVGRFKTLDFLVRRLKVAPGAAGGQKRAGGGLALGCRGEGGKIGSGKGGGGSELTARARA